MPQTQEWIDRRLGDARKAQPRVTDAVARQVKDLLQGYLSERSASRAELKGTATALIAKMTTPAASGTEAKHED